MLESQNPNSDAAKQAYLRDAATYMFDTYGEAALDRLTQDFDACMKEFHEHRLEVLRKLQTPQGVAMEVYSKLKERQDRWDRFVQEGKNSTGFEFSAYAYAVDWAKVLTSVMKGDLKSPPKTVKEAYDYYVPHMPNTSGSIWGVARTILYTHWTHGKELCKANLKEAFEKGHINQRDYDTFISDIEETRPD